MKTVSLIIPILNERTQLESISQKFMGYPKNVPIIICDGGSSDGSWEWIEQEFHGSKTVKIIQKKLASPSILKTILIGLELIETELVMIHPVDIDATNALRSISKRDIQEKFIICHKQYTDSHFLLTLQEFILNSLRVNLLHDFVWTNCPVIPKEDLISFKSETHGFLEDVILSDKLKKKYRPNIIKEPVIVSSRRYTNNGVFKRFIGNIFIMFLYRLKLRSIEELKKMYQG